MNFSKGKSEVENIKLWLSRKGQVKGSDYFSTSGRKETNISFTFENDVKLAGAGGPGLVSAAGTSYKFSVLTRKLRAP